ncbi:MAG: TRL-like family protein [Treponema sp.]|jgi:hypothetical protein|nr:TRL-like family protein [Treponema sp.]
MKKFLLFMASTVLFLSLAGCATEFYSPFAVTNNPIGSKVGQASYLEGGILKAAQEAGITRIATVDIKETALGRVFIVSGE